MKIISGTTDFKIEDGTAVAIGKFDGVHKGHKRLLHEIFEAKRLGLKTAVFTFDPSPAVFFQGVAQKKFLKESRKEPVTQSVTEPTKESIKETAKDPVKEIMTRQEKRICFERMGIDYLVEYPFNGQTAAVLAEDYVNHFLVEKMNARFIAAGEDVSFGHKGAGNAELLKKLAQQKGAQVRIIRKICHRGIEISSSYVRSEVEKGNMELVAELLEEPFFIMGKVAHGNRIGRTLGMPTVNIHPEEGKIMPPRGVYFSTVTYGEQIFYGVTNIGYKPTVESSNPRRGVETYIYDFNEDIYEKDITVHLHHFERPEQKFADLEELKKAIARNVEDGRKYFFS